MDAYVNAILVAFWLTAAACVVMVGAWWVREGRAERRIDAKARAVEGRIAARPRPSIVLPPDRASQSQAKGFVGYRVWSADEIGGVR
jgi:hypothetical protein